MAQEGGAQQNYVPPFGEIPASPNYYGGVPMQARSHLHTFLNHNRMEPPLEDTLQGTCNLLQPSKPMQTRWVKEMQMSLMCLDTFT
jgi:hypothetical protein